VTFSFKIKKKNNDQYIATCAIPCEYGYCSTPDQCTCQLEWSGSDCSECKNGYFPSEDVCLTCPNCGNGTCSDGPTGTGSCTCSTGYTTPQDSEDYCSICQDSYYPSGDECLPCDASCQTCNTISSHCTSYHFSSILLFV